MFLYVPFFYCCSCYKKKLEQGYFRKNNVNYYARKKRCKIRFIKNKKENLIKNRKLEQINIEIQIIYSEM